MMLRCCRLRARLFPPACAHHAPSAAFALVGMDGLDAMARTCCYASSASYAVDANSATTILPSERSRDDAMRPWLGYSQRKRMNLAPREPLSASVV